MLVQVLSDIHCEFHKDLGVSWLQSLKPTEVDVALGDSPEVLIVAGDLSSIECFDHIFMALCAMFPHVVYVTGNHEYYRHSPVEVHRKLEKMVKLYPNLHWLNNSSVVINGVKFLGMTLWFRDDPLNVMFEQNMGDFLVIKDFKPWVYKQNEKSLEKLRTEIDVDVVVTHHLPHPDCVSHFYRGSSLNRFFLCDVSNEMASLKPRLWVHGHTHGDRDFMVGETRIVCNPMGYPGEGSSKFKERLLITV